MNDVPVDFTAIDPRRSSRALRLRLDRIAQRAIDVRAKQATLRMQGRIWFGGLLAAAAIALVVWVPLLATSTTSASTTTQTSSSSRFTTWLERGACMTSVWNDPMSLGEDCSP